MKQRINTVRLWYLKTKEEALVYFKSSSQGISSAEALKRLGEYGHNELEEKKKKTSFMMLLDQFKDFNCQTHKNVLYPMLSAFPKRFAISFPMGRLPFSISEIWR